MLKAKYVGDEKVGSDIEAQGINLIDKTLMVRGARISYSIWEVKGQQCKFKILCRELKIINN